MVNQAAALLQSLDDDGIRLIDLQAGHERRARVEAAIVTNRVRDRQAIALPDSEVLLAVAGRGVHGARTGIQGDMVAENDRDLTILERMLQHQAFEGTAGRVSESRHGGHAIALQTRLEQVRGQYEPVALAVLVGFGENVAEIATQGDRLVGRHRPGCRGPDDDVKGGTVETPGRQLNPVRQRATVDYAERASMAGEVCSWYSTSASARAERQSRHQCTGFTPL